MIALETIPDGLPRYEMDRIARGRVSITTETHTGPDGELRWNSNDRPVPVSAFREAYMVPPACQAEVEIRDMEAFLREYVERERFAQPDAEQLSEMRAAFGPGAEVVNVITGRRMRV